MLRRTLLRPFLAVAFATLTLPAAAAVESSSCSLERSLLSLHRDADQVIFDPDAPPSTELLFLALPASLSLEPGDSLRIEISAGAEPLLVETLELQPALAKQDRQSSESAPAVAGTVVELLSRHAGERALLHDLAQWNDLEIVGFLCGEEVLRLSFSELLAADAGQGDRELPVPVLSELQVERGGPETQSAAAEPRSISAASNACLQACDDEYLDCVAYRCDYYDCSACRDQQASCYASCGVCAATSTTVSETVLFSTTPVPGVAHECFRLGAVQIGAPFEWTRYRYKTTTKRIDQHADCSVTETTLSVTYSDNFCFRLFPGPPCGAWQFPYNMCN
jgi:hypothetical protein